MRHRSANEARYPAFLAVRWGFARVEGGRLLPTEKWEQRHAYDEKGFVNGAATIRVAAISSTKTDSMSVATPPSKLSAAPSPTSAHAQFTNDFDGVKAELNRRRQLLIQWASDQSLRMDPVDRQHILDYFRDKRLPERPSTAEGVMRELISSALSINQPPFWTKNRLTKLLGQTPLGPTIGLCLARLLDASELAKSKEVWAPATLHAELLRIGSQLKPAPESFEHSVLRTSIDCAKALEHELREGLDDFYRRVDEALKASPERTWQFMTTLSAPIAGVGPVLTSDFLKNIGFHRLVKIDQRLRTQLPALVPTIDTGSDRTRFISAWKLADMIGWNPFILDHLLFQWGNRDYARFDRSH